MGIDCVVLVGNKLTNLDRWYVFYEVFEPAVDMSRTDAIRKLEAALPVLALEDAEDDEAHKDYRQYWAEVALRAMRESDAKMVVFVRDCDDDYQQTDHYKNAWADWEKRMGWANKGRG